MTMRTPEQWYQFKHNHYVPWKKLIAMVQKEVLEHCEIPTCEGCGAQAQHFGEVDLCNECMRGLIPTQAQPEGGSDA